MVRRDGWAKPLKKALVEAAAAPGLYQDLDEPMQPEELTSPLPALTVDPLQIPDQYPEIPHKRPGDRISDVTSYS